MKILVCPLDWGLGHAARCIPLIRALRSLGHEVRFAASGGALRLLRSEFPDLAWADLPGYRVRYARSAGLFLPALLAQAPAIFLGLWAEGRRLRRLLQAAPCDLILSDGRYGLRASGVPSVLITHQIAFRAPPGLPLRAWAEGLLLRLNLRALGRFDKVWIPDFPGALSLAGDLAGPTCTTGSTGPSGPSGPAGNREWIGPLGRFPPDSASPRPPIDVAAVVSGPEPQRALFEAALRKALSALSGTRILVRGLPGAAGPGLDALRAGELNVFDHLPGRDLARVFAGAGAVIARSGYTTVMELASLGAAAAVLVPTPGQTEQEYLADHLASLGAAFRADQDALDLEGSIAEARSLPGFGRWRRDDPQAGLARFLAAHPLVGVGKGSQQ